MKKKNRITSLLLVMVMVLSVTFLGGCSKDNSEKVVVTINDEDIYLNEAMYYIYAIEGNFAGMVGPEYWDVVVSEDKTFGELTKDYVMDGLTETNILYQEGKAAGIEIDGDMETQLKSSAVEFYNSLSEEIVEITGLDEETIYNISAKSYIASTHQNNVLNELEIDTEAITAEYDKEALRQYDTEYLFVPITSTDEEGNVTALSDEEKDAAKATLEGGLAEVQGGKTFAEVADTNETIQTSTASFIEGEESYTVSQEYMAAALPLENDGITGEILETEDGYYIIKMVNNNSDAYYNSTVENAISTKQQELYYEQYEALKETYTIEINEDVWDPIQLGKTTINLESDETEAPSEDENDEVETQAEDTDAGDTVAEETDAGEEETSEAETDATE